MKTDYKKINNDWRTVKPDNLEIVYTKRFKCDRPECENYNDCVNGKCPPCLKHYPEIKIGLSHTSTTTNKQSEYFNIVIQCNDYKEQIR